MRVQGGGRAAARTRRAGRTDFGEDARDPSATKVSKLLKSSSGGKSPCSGKTDSDLKNTGFWQIPQETWSGIEAYFVELEGL